MIRNVQCGYGVGDFFLFSDDRKFHAFSLKAVSRRRLEKILFTACSLNSNACRKYGCTHTRVGKSMGLDGKVVCKEPRLIGIFESELKGQASRAHFEFLSSSGVKIRGERMELCGFGKEKLELVHAIVD